MNLGGDTNILSIAAPITTQVCVVIFILLFIYLFVCFIYLFLSALVLCCCAGFLQLWPAGATLRCGAQASRRGGFSCCGAWALVTWASVVVACRLQSAGSAVVAPGFIAPRHVGSSRTRARTCVPCIGRWTPNHCTTREALCDHFQISPCEARPTFTSFSLTLSRSVG